MHVYGLKYGLDMRTPCLTITRPSPSLSSQSQWKSQYQWLTVAHLGERHEHAQPSRLLARVGAIETQPSPISDPYISFHISFFIPLPLPLINRLCSCHNAMRSKHVCLTDFAIGFCFRSA